MLDFNGNISIYRLNHIIPEIPCLPPAINPQNYPIMYAEVTQLTLIMVDPADMLQKACRLGDPGLVRKALEIAGDHVNILDSKLGWSPLYRSVICGHFEAARLLLAKGADPNLRTKAGEVPLHPASDSGNCKLVQLLLEHSADPNQLSHGSPYVDHESPLLRATRKGNHRLAWLLLRYGADANVQDAMLGQTALHVAAAMGNSRLVQVLVEANASRDIRDKQGLVPADIAESDDIRAILRVANFPVQSVPPQLETSSPIPSEADINRSIALEHSEDTALSVPAFALDSKLRQSFKRYSTVHLSTQPAKPVSPEQENTSNLSTSRTGSADYKKSALYLWLSSLRLHPLFEVLIEEGYGDVESLVIAVKAGEVTLERLETLGIEKIGWRLRLMACLEEEAKGRPMPSPASDLPSLDIWLDSLRLSELFRHFQAAGLDDMEHLLGLMHTKYALDDHLLETHLGISQLGSRHRILLRLYDDAHMIQSMLVPSHAGGAWPAVERERVQTACELCSLM